MKKLSIEQKAQRYDEALERAKEWYNPTDADLYTCIVESVFPELKESEDEKIRNFLIDYFETLKSTLNDGIWKGFKIDDIISYIGRQKEQNLVEWSEEDERIYQSIMEDTVQENQLNGKQTDWLRDIKYRYFSQPKQEWSEEDKPENYKDLIEQLQSLMYEWSNKKDNMGICINKYLQKIVSSIKSLKPQTV